MKIDEAAEATERNSVTMEEFYYGDHDLHKIALYQVPPRRNEPRHHNAIWLIYIHGGAWRDPTISERSFEKTVNILLSCQWIHKIKGFASLSYRLSSHPEHNQEQSISINSRREAKHPDHINDVLRALTFLHENFQVGHRYILVGHSCGATLAFQTIMSRFAMNNFFKPKAIVGVAGIYNLRGLRDRHPNKDYEKFISGAFGEDEAVWDSVSPISMKASDNPWSNGKLVVLTSSTQDELIEHEQMDEMETTLEDYRLRGLKVVTWRRILCCSHDEIWQTDWLAEVLAKVLDIYFSK